jgi:hypothetical protein
VEYFFYWHKKPPAKAEGKKSRKTLFSLYKSPFWAIFICEIADLAASAIALVKVHIEPPPAFELLVQE